MTNKNTNKKVTTLFQDFTLWSEIRDLVFHEGWLFTKDGAETILHPHSFAFDPGKHFLPIAMGNS